MATSTMAIQAPLELSPWQGVNSLENGVTVRSVDEASQENPIMQQLEAADGGYAARRVLIAGFVFEALLFGFSMSFGVFQDYYSSLPQFAGNPNIALIGTLNQGVSYLGAPLAALLTKRFPRYHRQIIWISWPICLGGLLAASFATTIGGLIATQGVMYGAAFIILTYPILSMIDEWWILRKGMALGLISSASGAAGSFMPFVTSALLQRYGYQITLRAIAIAMALLTAPLLPFLKGRLPISETNTMAKTNWSFLSKPLFWVFGLSTLVQGLGFFLPALWLPTYATSVGLSTTQGALILAVMSVSQLLGQFSFGFLTDKQISVSTLAVTCSSVSMLASLLVWGFSKSIGLLILFAILYGFFGYAFGAMRAGMGKSVSDDPSSVIATYAILVFLQGIGNVLAGPISSGLMKNGVRVGTYGVGRFASLIGFVGVCMATSAIVIVAYGVGGRWKKL